MHSTVQHNNKKNWIMPRTNHCVTADTSGAGEGGRAADSGTRGCVPLALQT